MSATEADRRWLAGVIDAGGTIRIAHGKGWQGRGTYWAVVSVRNRSRALLDRVVAVAGVGAVRQEAAATATRAAYHAWAVSAGEATGVIEAVRPHLLAQAAVADAALVVQRHNADNPGKAGRPAEVTAALDRARAQSRSPRPALTDTERRAIRALDGIMTGEAIAALFGVAPGTVSKILGRDNADHPR